MLYTIGHGDRSARDLNACLAAHAIEVVIDIRSWPRSRRFPWFDRESLAGELAAMGIEYGVWGRSLGGLRRHRSGANERHPALGEPALRAFADWMETARFAAAVEALRPIALERRVAMLCAERDPENCHRRLIADHLVAVEGVAVAHLLAADAAPRPHCLTPGARRSDSGLRYDRTVTRPLPLDPPDSE